MSPPAPPRSVLIVRLSAIGDVIHALPVLEALRAQLPKARIGWLVEELSAPLLHDHPDLDALYVIPKKRWRGNFRKYFAPEIQPFYAKIRRDRWEATLDLQGLAKSSAAAWVAGARRRVGFAGPNAREASFLLNNRRIRPHPGDRHVVQQNLRLLEGIGLTVPDAPPRGRLGITTSEQDTIRAKMRWAGWREEPTFAINPGAGWASKLYPPRLYGELGRLVAQHTGLRPMVLWGPREEAMRDEILTTMEGTGAFAAPPTTIRELAALISVQRLFIGGDTGPSHLCGPLRVPVLTIFGASDGRRNAPWPTVGPEPAGLVAQRTDLPCVPCWKTRCPLEGREHMACLKEFSAEAIFARARPWLDTLG